MTNRAPTVQMIKCKMHQTEEITAWWWAATTGGNVNKASLRLVTHWTVCAELWCSVVFTKSPWLVTVQEDTAQTYWPMSISYRQRDNESAIRPIHHFHQSSRPQLSLLLPVCVRIAVWTCWGGLWSETRRRSLACQSTSVPATGCRSRPGSQWDARSGDRPLCLQVNWTDWNEWVCNCSLRNSME